MLNTKGFKPETGEWNDSLTGDFIWGNTNIGEALSFVMTPFTWSFVGEAYDQMNVLPGYHVTGNIGGRAYQNGSVMISALGVLGRDTDDLFREMGGIDEPIEGLTIPVIPISFADRFSILFNGVRIKLKEGAALRNLSKFLAENPNWSQAEIQQAQASKTIEQMAQQWPAIEERSRQVFWYVVSTAWQYGEAVAPLRRELISLVGDVDAHLLLSNVSSEMEVMAGLGPVVGLSKVAHGKMTRQEYLDEYGHRGPYEAEFAAPRPFEDPDWLDQQLAAFVKSNVDVDELLAGQRAGFDEAWMRFQQRYPEREDAMRIRLENAAEAIRMREAARSELARLVWVARVWARRFGELTELGDDIFYLIKEEMLELMAGGDVPRQYIPARKETHARYSALPVYPPVISGHFDPFEWASFPDRPMDVYDSHVPDLSSRLRPAAPNMVKGIAGSAGCVEGMVRRIDTPEDGDQLQRGEILVTSQTNVGWTLLFPRAAAVVTDVGAPLSHAAIVARELGIPAVVGCVNATSFLKTGDRVRVDGSKGVVELLEAA